MGTKSRETVYGSSAAPFAAFLSEVRRQSDLRAAITAACRRTEAACLQPLLDIAATSAADAARIREIAGRLVIALRANARKGGVEGLIHEYALSSQEGVALMCLAEALLRIPDAQTRDALIRDKISTGDWRSHVGHSPSLFVNAATWGLLITGRLTTTTNETNLAASLVRLIAQGGEPLIRRGVDVAMRMLGEQFVTGETIAQALANSRRMEARGFQYSYDMLGEAAATAEDAARYYAAYEHAIHAIGRAAAGRGIYEGPGISIKLSALFPRYARSQIGRVIGELLPRVKRLALLARSYDIGLNLDAEEADRLELSLDILEALCVDADLAGWNGIGFVIQAYGKRCPFVIDWLIDLARRSRRRIMVRLVKGAYWDTEIKRAQVDGLADFPVFTRKVHTDVSYLACARKLLAAPDAVYPQFATHNAQTVASIIVTAGPNYYRGQYEFQCLHGMGEPLYEEVIRPSGPNRPCRIYAPVGTHETLLAYLVRRLLENGANSSFVNRIADPTVAIDDLIVDPVAAVRAMPSPGAPHPAIARPDDLYRPHRQNSRGLDLSDETALAELGTGLAASLHVGWTAVPGGSGASPDRLVLDPADHSDVVGKVRFAEPAEVSDAVSTASRAMAAWEATSVAERAACLRRCADAMQARNSVLIGLLVREAGKSFSNAIAEIREAIDFLRYYAAEAERAAAFGPGKPLGPVVCISPWNFPLAIFTGQIAAALVTGNPVLAKPAEETPLIAAEAVRLLHEAGIPVEVLQLVPGPGEVGAALVADPRVQGVIFTGSTAVAKLIQRGLAERLTTTNQVVPLIAETGGQNAMIVDSSALAEQVVGDIIASAFDSAGQRCSALRILCLQEDIAERTLVMLKGAMGELAIGNPDRLSIDIGPVITDEARSAISAHIEAMRGRGHAVTQLPLPPETSAGTFVPPTLIEISAISEVEREVFGPVLHVLRYARQHLDRLIGDINAAGFGLTFGLHTRVDETIARVVDRVSAGNVYINRNMIGATVGVQPFGGSGLSGTGPKAGGPLYLGRLTAMPGRTPLAGGTCPPALAAYIEWLRRNGNEEAAKRCATYGARTLHGLAIDLPGPVGERNAYRLEPRGIVGAIAATEAGFWLQLGAILATGNTVLIEQNGWMAAIVATLPEPIARLVAVTDVLHSQPALDAVLFEGSAQALRDLNGRIAERDGPIMPVQGLTTEVLTKGGDYDLNLLFEERVVSINTTASGGNAHLMSIG
jgi:RHH-type proline utilization regulon transcriptional repressor/proline dehydrogenase/delta 1-pyrroline-5-carboxylate dehydrogenase